MTLRALLISELACEMEGAGKGNKSLYTRENCQGVCDKKCSLEGEGDALFINKIMLSC